MKDERLIGYFSGNPAWRRQLALLRKKYVTGYKDGIIKLEDAILEECMAAENLLGRHFKPPVLRYKISEFEAALRTSVFQIPDLSAFWQRLEGQTLKTNSQMKTEQADQIEAFFAQEEAVFHGSVAKVWLQALHGEHGYGYQVLQPFIGKEKAATRWLHWVCCVLDRLEQQRKPEELALCSNAICGDPHALDFTRPAGRLLPYALAHWQHKDPPRRARERLALFKACGLFLDDISCFTAQRGLQLFCTPEQEHSAYSLLRQNNEFCLLTLSQIEKLAAVTSLTGKIFIVENQMLFSALCRESRGEQPLLCTSGQFREATWLLLDMLAESGCEFWYAGDFDPEGVNIADRLWQEYPNLVHFWHMQPEDYEQTVSSVPISNPRLSQLNKIQCPDLKPLAEAIQQRKFSSYQESLFAAYLQDLKIS